MESDAVRRLSDWEDSSYQRDGDLAVLLRNVEYQPAKRGIHICYETVRLCWNRFGPMFAIDIKRQQISLMRGNTPWRWDTDEVFLTQRAA